MSLSSLRESYEKLCRQLPGGDAHASRFSTKPSHDGTPYVEFDGSKYYLVVCERGVEFERKSSEFPDEVLYWLMSGAVSDLAGDFELKHRRQDEDSRRLQFAKELELFRRLDAAWALRREVEHELILRCHPYDDEALSRALEARRNWPPNQQ